MAAIPYQYSPLKSRAGHHTEFRLLTLWPGIRDEPLRCSIQHTPLDNAPMYEALSYTWGNPKGEANTYTPGMGDFFSIHILRVSPYNQSLNIGHNLWEALCHVRDSQSPRVLWVDAICINQADVKERSQQVTWMAPIYGNAFRVLAWLGKEDSFTELAFDTIEEICWATKLSIWKYCASQLQIPLKEVTGEHVASLSEKMKLSSNTTDEDYCLSTARLIKGLSLVQPASFDSSVSSDNLASTAFGRTRTFAKALMLNEDLLSPHLDMALRWQSLAETFDYRSYWRRLWIVQEIIHAKHVMILCGPRSLDMNVFSIVTMGILPTRSSPFPVLLPSLQAGNNAYHIQNSIVRTGHLTVQRYLPKMRLSNALEDFSQSKCSDLRDKIFALLNICQPIRISIDYRAGVSQIYSTTTKEVIRQNCRLDIIFRKPRFNVWTECENVELPSWTPKYYQPLVGGVLGYSPRWGEELMYNAGMLSEVEDVFMISNPSILPVRGYYVDTIARSTQTPTDLLPPNSHTGIWELVLSLQSQLDQNSSGHQTDQIFWESIVIGTWPKEMPIWGRLRKEPALWDDFAAAVAAAKRDGPTPKLLEHLRVALYQKHFCLTKQGRIAMVHGYPRPGDDIFVARGASAPIVIRPVARTELAESSLSRSRIRRLLSKDKAGEIELEKKLASYEFIGACFVHGIMDGEVLEMNEGKGEQGQLIQLM